MLALNYTNIKKKMETDSFSNIFFCHNMIIFSSHNSKNK